MTQAARDQMGQENIPVAFAQEYELLREVCATMRSGFVLLNHREQITYSNPSAQRLFQLQHAQGSVDVRQHLVNMARDPRIAQEELSRLWQADQEEVSADLALVDAAQRWLRVRCFPVFHTNGQLLGRGLIFDDITLEKQALEHRAETLSVAAHELKTPLAVIKGCATTLLGASMRWDPSLQREMLQMIDAQSDKLYEILNTLLDVWKFDAGSTQLQLSQVEVRDLLQQLLQRWQRSHPGYAFRMNVPSEMPALVCDAVRLEQALDHLMRNAVTYAPAGTTITISAEALEDRILLHVQDQGRGIAETDLERIFDRFYRVHQHEQGSGLGLSSVKATIEAHRGTVWAESEGAGRGAIFHIALPLARPVLPITAPMESLPAQGKVLLRTDQRAHILLAESDQRLTRYIKAHLEEQQYRAQTVSHGLQFLKHIDLEEPDCILLSARLQDMMGMELLQRLREFSHVPVIMLVDECDEETRVAYFQAGCDDLLVKPFGVKELLARIAAILRRQQPIAEQQQKRHFSTGALSIDYAQHQVTVRGQIVQLSRTEYKLLTTLAQNAGMVVTHELLLEKVWGPEYHRDVDFIWVYISRLRRKIEQDPRKPEYILTVPDVGYKLAKHT